MHAGYPLTFIPYNGIRSNNIDSAYVKTSLKYSDIKQKTNVSLLMLTRTPVGNNLEYDGGFFYNAEEERKFMQIGGTAGSISYCGNFGEHTGRVISPDVPKMLINTRYGLAEGTDSIWAFYGGNGKDLMSYYFEQHEVDTTSIFVNEPTFSICAINYSLEERPKFFSTRGIGFIGVTKFALNSNGARALSRCVNWLDNVFGVHDWESDTLFTRMTTLPDSDKAGINEAIIELKDSLNIRRLSDKFKRFSIYLMNDTINALKDGQLTDTML